MRKDKLFLTIVLSLLLVSCAKSPSPIEGGIELDEFIPGHFLRNGGSSNNALSSGLFDATTDKEFYFVIDLKKYTYPPKYFGDYGSFAFLSEKYNPDAGGLELSIASYDCPKVEVGGTSLTKVSGIDEPSSLQMNQYTVFENSDGSKFLLFKYPENLYQSTIVITTSFLNEVPSNYATFVYGDFYD